jgi:predicted RNase H-like nuclease (RuvC/YqgF family)
MITPITCQGKSPIAHLLSPNREKVAKERESQRVWTTGLSAEDSASMRAQQQSSQAECGALQRRHGELGARLRELEELLEQAKAEGQSQVAEREREIGVLREQIGELMATYDELMSRKTSLEFEINTYRRLLECEETRIKTNMTKVPEYASSYKVCAIYSDSICCQFQNKQVDFFLKIF